MFAFQIDERVKARLYNICRLCGLDNREQIVIVDEDKSMILCEDEASLCKKIFDCIGIQVRFFVSGKLINFKPIY